VARVYCSIDEISGTPIVGSDVFDLNDQENRKKCMKK